MRKRTSMKGVAAPFVNQIRVATSCENITLDTQILRESLAQPLKIFIEAQTKSVTGSSILSSEFTEIFRSTIKNISGFTEMDALAVLLKAGIALGIQVKRVSSGYLLQTILLDRAWVSNEGYIEIVPITEEPTAKKAIKKPKCENKKEEADEEQS